MGILRKPDLKGLVERAVQALDDGEDIGLCLNCGEEYGEPLEPDARRVMCPHCGERSVYGAEEIILLGAS